MNERMRELAKQAGFIGTNLHNTVIGTTQETALQNFAELIVQECMNNMEFHGHDDSVSKLNWFLVNRIRG